MRTGALSAFGVPRVAQFAVTNRCNGKCKICSIWKQKEKVTVSKEEGLRVIDKFASLGVMHVTFTGGEPMMNPHIYDFIARAQKHKMYVGVCCGDPRLITEKSVQKLHECGPVVISMSFDTPDAELNSELRGIPDIHTKFRHAVELLKGKNVTLVAGPTITQYTWNRLPELIDKIRDIGFHFVNISYPTQSLSKTFQIGGDDTTHIELSNEQIIESMENLLGHIKQNNNDPFIINPPLSIKNMIKFLQDPKTVDYQCLGGWKVFSVDWFLDVYSCWRSDTKLGSILDPDFELKKTTHNACTMSWFRDFSVFFQDGGRTVLHHIFSGNFDKYVKLMK